MLEEQQVNATLIMGVQLIIFACHLTHNIHCPTGMDIRARDLCMQRNMNPPYKEPKTTMFPVLFV